MAIVAGSIAVGTQASGQAGMALEQELSAHIIIHKLEPERELTGNGMNF